jgi:hypothetical protein
VDIQLKFNEIIDNLLMAYESSSILSRDIHYAHEKFYFSLQMFEVEYFCLSTIGPAICRHHMKYFAAEGEMWNCFVLLVQQ